jgi:hypothetical protein
MRNTTPKMRQRTLVECCADAASRVAARASILLSMSVSCRLELALQRVREPHARCLLWGYVGPAVMRLIR